MKRREFLETAMAGALVGGTVPSVLAGTASGLPPATSRYIPTHFVTAEATGGGDGSRERPWTWVEAYQQADAGMKVEFAPGIYHSPGNDARGRAYVFGPRRSGSSGSPIVFYARVPAVYSDDDSTHSQLVIGAPGGTCTGAMIGTQHVTWDGFSMRQTAGNNFGSEESVWSAWGSSHLRLLRCLFDQQGIGYQGPGANNWGAIFMQVVDHVEIADCRFLNIPGVDENTATYLVYGVGEVELHHCEFTNNWQNFYIKGVPPDAKYDLMPHDIHHNLIRNWTSEMLVMFTVGQRGLNPTSYCDFRQNSFSTDRRNLSISYRSWPETAPRQFRFVNNSFFGRTHPGAEHGEGGFHWYGGALMPSSRIWSKSLFQNNVVEMSSGARDFVYISAGGHTREAVGRYVHDYNYYNNIRRFYGGSFGSWQRGGQDVHSLRGDSPFVDGAGGDLRLKTDSKARSAGRDVLGLLGQGSDVPINMGAYILPGDADVLGVRSQAVTDAEI